MTARITAEDVLKSDSTEESLADANPLFNDDLILTEICKALPREATLRLLSSLSQSCGKEFLDGLNEVVPQEHQDLVRRNIESQNAGIDEVSMVEGCTSSLTELVNNYDGLESTGHYAILRNQRLRAMAEWTPVRLSYSERHYMRLVIASLDISQYTDHIDVPGGNSVSRVRKEIRYICQVLAGLLVTNDFAEGRRLLAGMDGSFAEHTEIFSALFEVGRRYKVLNPEKLRQGYGKMIHLLMDSRRSQVYDVLGLDLIVPVATVSMLLEKWGISELLMDPLLGVATMEIMTEERKSFDQLRSQKEEAVRQLLDNYGPSKPSAFRGFAISSLMSVKYLLTGTSPENEEDETGNGQKFDRDDLMRVIYSLGDHHNHIRANCYIIDQLQDLLETNFTPTMADAEPERNLTISAGQNGARLSRSHERQYLYVKQTLKFWRAVLADFYELWTAAEEDLLAFNNRYVFQETGQGYHRVQRAPSVSVILRRLVSNLKAEMGYWIGSEVFHLGDSAVPNALVFVDKYTQIPRIIQPLMSVISQLPRLFKEPYGEPLRQMFDSAAALRITILSDFFRYGFDGSGADNFYQAGSCIDGRLTSVWNWCSLISKKRYYVAFKLAEFSGFDGDF